MVYMKRCVIILSSDQHEAEIVWMFKHKFVKKPECA